MNDQGRGKKAGNLGAEAWRQIVDSAIDTAIISIDTEGRITSWNEGARQILGWTATRCSGRRWIACFRATRARR